MDAAIGITRGMLTGLMFWIAVGLSTGCANTKEWHTLQEVHSESLEHFHYMSDPELYGKKDYWAKPGENVYKGVKLGDCEDYALWVSDKLKKKGYDPLVVLTKDKTHAYLVVNGWIIDSKHKEIQRPIFAP